MSKHTPGPWRTEETGLWPETNHWLGIYCDSGTGQVAKIEGYGVHATANANLIAAAPDLLQTLKDMIDNCSWCADACAEPCANCQRAEEAISKAEGGE